MKLPIRILLRLAPVLCVVMGAWAAMFYHTLIDEVDEEVNEVLEHYAERIIARKLAGHPLPENDGLHERFTLRPVGEELPDDAPGRHYFDGEIELDGEHVPARFLRATFRSADEGWWEIEAATPTLEKEDVQQAILHGVVLLYVVLLGTVLTLCFWVVRRSLRPLYTLLHRIDAYRPGEPRTPLDNPTRITEFRRLNDAAERSIERVEGSLERQKEFVANASHEMQTPLAVCTGRLDLLAQSPLDADQLEQVQRMRRTLSALSRMNRSLLLLSRIEQGAFSERRPVDWEAVVRPIVEDYRELYSARGQRVELTVEGVCRAEADESLARTLVQNVVRNAFVHGAPLGEVRIRLDPARLTVADTATDGALDGGRIFERFYRSSEGGGSGVGLALAEAVCRLYGWRIGYRFLSGEHVFEIDFAAESHFVR